MKKPEFYVSMIDTFMSGWGEAEGKDNMLQIACANYKQANQIANHARKRPEMKKVHINSSRHPQPFNPHLFISNKTYSDMGGVWIENGGRIAS